MEIYALIFYLQLINSESLFTPKTYISLAIDADDIAVVDFALTSLSRVFV